MKSNRKWSGVLAGALLFGVLVPFATSASAATPPPWEPDVNTEGNIVFYNAAGNVVTGGNNLNHLFDYAAATSAATRPTTKAQVSFAFPDHNNPTTETWFQTPASGATNYPNTTAPAPVKSITFPVAKANSSEANLNAALGGAVLDTTAGYANIVQLRLFDAGPGLGNGKQTKPYWQADISYNTANHTWAEVFPSVAQATTTSLAASPAGHQAPGASIQLTASVTPAAAAGKVQFTKDGTNVGTPITVTSGTATTATTITVSGAHTFQANFTPTDSGVYTSSSSAALHYLIGTAPGAPTAAHATAGHASAVVSWTAPANTGGSTITGYDVQYSANGGTGWTSASAAFHTSTATTQTVAGLHNGSSYVFRVAAINAIGTGAYSAMSAAVKPFADATSLTISRAKTITYGQSVAIAAKLIDSKTHKAIGAATLTLYSRTSTARPFAKVKTARTTSAGAASLSLRPHARTYYEWKYLGSTVHAARTSAVDTVSVAQVVTAAAKPTRATHGKRFAVYGTVAPSTTKLKVSLQVKVGSKYKTISSASTKKQKLPNGKTTVGFVFSVLETKKANYSFRVIRAATSTLAAGTSRSVTVKVV